MDGVDLRVGDAGGFERVAQLMRLDVLAVDASRVLGQASIPHVLLKGPSTANWLYNPPRAYRDVDMLVPATRSADAVVELERAGIATARAGRVGEEAPHSQLLIAPGGLQLDLHVALPMMSTAGHATDDVWRVLSRHVMNMPLIGDDSVPVLDIPGRCVVLTLHALASGYDSEQVRDDLQRAQAVTSGTDWRTAAHIADELFISDLFQAGLRVITPGDWSDPEPIHAYLKRTQAVGGAFGLQRILDAPLGARPRMVWRELFPSPGFIRYANHLESTTPRRLLLLYARRWAFLGRQLPVAVQAVHAAKRALRGARN